MIIMVRKIPLTGSAAAVSDRAGGDEGRAGEPAPGRGAGLERGPQDWGSAAEGGPGAAEKGKGETSEKHLNTSMENFLEKFLPNDD